MGTQTVAATRTTEPTGGWAGGVTAVAARLAAARGGGTLQNEERIASTG